MLSIAARSTGVCVAVASPFTDRIESLDTGCLPTVVVTDDAHRRGAAGLRTDQRRLRQEAPVPAEVQLRQAVVQRIHDRRRYQFGDLCQRQVARITRRRRLPRPAVGQEIRSTLDRTEIITAAELVAAIALAGATSAYFYSQISALAFPLVDFVGVRQTNRAGTWALRAISIDGRDLPVLAIDYLNDQCDVEVQSRWTGATPDAEVLRMAQCFADAAWRVRQSSLRPQACYALRVG